MNVSELGRQVAVDFEPDADFHKCGGCPRHLLFPYSLAITLYGLHHAWPQAPPLLPAAPPSLGKFVIDFFSSSLWVRRDVLRSGRCCPLTGHYPMPDRDGSPLGGLRGRVIELLPRDRIGLPINPWNASCSLIRIEMPHCTHSLAAVKRKASP